MVIFELIIGLEVVFRLIFLAQNRQKVLNFGLKVGIIAFLVIFFEILHVLDIKP